MREWTAPPDTMATGATPAARASDARWVRSIIEPNAAMSAGSGSWHESPGSQSATEVSAWAGSPYPGTTTAA